MTYLLHIGEAIQLFQQDEEAGAIQAYLLALSGVPHVKIWLEWRR